MASSKEQPTSRPVSGSFSKIPPGSRIHSHSISLAANNPTHRVNRRKSINASASATAQAAIAAAFDEHGDVSAMPVNNHRRSIGSKKNIESQSMSARPNMHSYFHRASDSAAVPDQEAVEDNSYDEDTPTQQKSAGNKTRNRRASEGAHLVKGEGKKSGELRCDTCGKGYKHSSCLTKHMWEHDPAWAFTSKLLISKHQQVQLLEAASVLCNMTAENPTGHSDIEPIQVDPSEASSASPGYSGSSEMQDELSSVETTPPPMSDAGYPVPNAKRFSSSSNGVSRSYRSIPSSSFADSVHSPGLPPQRYSGVDFRPSTAGTDDGALAAATAGLTFAGTPRSRASILATDIPPVPPLPQQYQSFNSKSSDSTLTNVYNPLHMHPPALTQQLSDERNYRDGSNERRKDDFGHHDIQMEDEEMFKMEE